jgi:hypothetical protein
VSVYSDPAWRAVEQDRLAERGQRMLMLPVLVACPQYYGGYGDGGGYGGYGYGDGGYGYGGYGDGGGYGGYGYGYGGYGYGGYGDGGDGGDGGGDYGGYGGGDYGGYGGGSLTQEDEMRNGLAIVTTPGGSYPYVRVGWLQHRDGDWWELRGCRVIKRFGQGNATLAGLAQTGPVRGTELLTASPVEHVHALHCIRVIPADPTAWAKDCPEPAS